MNSPWRRRCGSNIGRKSEHSHPRQGVGKNHDKHPRFNG